MDFPSYSRTFKGGSANVRLFGFTDVSADHSFCTYLVQAMMTCIDDLKQKLEASFAKAHAADVVEVTFAERISIGGRQVVDVFYTVKTAAYIDEAELRKLMAAHLKGASVSAHTLCLMAEAPRGAVIIVLRRPNGIEYDVPTSEEMTGRL